jgi:23S rRNA (guanosine2251-2'-O)-methyltransferase
MPPWEGMPPRLHDDVPARPGGRGAQPWRRPDPPDGPIRPGAPAPPLEEGEELVAGRRPVEEAFAAGRPARRLLVTPQRRQALEKIVLHATTLRIPIVEVEGGSLTALAGFDGHQGVAVIVEARRFASVDDILARSIERGEPPFAVVLDSLEDPQNVGTLLRSAEAVGVHGVVFPTERQAPLSPAAIKASAGATEHLLLAPVDDLPATLTDLHLRGARIVGSEADAPLTAREADLRGPIALVVGSEGHGLSPAVRRRCDLFVRLPMRGAIGSLNAAVAGSVLLFEILGQRETGSGEAPVATKPRAGRNSAAAAAATPDGATTVEVEQPGPVTEPEPAEKTKLAADKTQPEAVARTNAKAAARTKPEAAPAPEADATRKAAPAPKRATKAKSAPRATAAKSPKRRTAETETPPPDDGDDLLPP